MGSKGSTEEKQAQTYDKKMFETEPVSANTQKMGLNQINLSKKKGHYYKFKSKLQKVGDRNSEDNSEMCCKFESKLPTDDIYQNQVETKAFTKKRKLRRRRNKDLFKGIIDLRRKRKIACELSSKISENLFSTIHSNMEEDIENAFESYNQKEKCKINEENKIPYSNQSTYYINSFKPPKVRDKKQSKASTNTLRRKDSLVTFGRLTVDENEPIINLQNEIEV